MPKAGDDFVLGMAAYFLDRARAAAKDVNVTVLDQKRLMDRLGALLDADDWTEQELTIIIALFFLILAKGQKQGEPDGT